MRKLILLFTVMFLAIFSYGQRANSTSITVNQNITDLSAGNWKVFHSNGAAAIIELTNGADGTFLMSNGAAVAPTWETVTATPTWADIATNSTSTVHQTFALNAATNAIFEESTGTDLLVIDGTNDRVGVLDGTPAYGLTIGGTTQSQRYLTVVASSQSTGSTVNLDTRANADSDVITMTASLTLNLNYLDDGQTGEVLFRQDGTGNFVLTIAAFNDNATSGLDEKYSGGLSIINPDANSYTAIKYKVMNNTTTTGIVLINIIYYE